MKRRGRPPKPPEKRREQRLDLRVSEAEKEMFKLAAASSQQDLSVWIRVQLHRTAADALGDNSERDSESDGEDDA